MKKLNYSRWLLTALAAMTVFSAPAAKKTFTAVTSNVDGLPPTVNINYGVGEANPTMNADGSQEPGATRMGQLIGESLWDIVALSEDFNYHNYIMDGVNTYYNASKHRGKIEQSNLDGSLVGYLSQSVRMNTDGLCMLTRKKYSVYPQPDQEGDGDKNKGSVNNWVLWNDHYGYTDNEADGLIRKGFRFYQVTLAEGLVVDVYITHMEAGSKEGDNAARAKQLTQFAEYIKAHKGTNPIIILGDTNCRYTRDPLKAGFIDVIEQDPDLHVQDPWVQHMWDGVYPTPNSESLMVGTLGEQKGEVVDKIWYINNDKSKSTLTCTGYLHDDAFTYADGGQIADHYPVVGTFVIENPEAPEPSTGEVTIPDPDPKVPVVSGQTYFIRNVGSGMFLRAGGAYTTQAVMGDYPSKVKPAKVSGDKWTLQTTHDNKWLRWDGNNYFMDQEKNEWTLTQVPGMPNVYTLTDASNQAVSHANGVLAPATTANATDKNQQWEFLTQADLLHELYYASSATPKDVTFMMKAPDFGYADQESWTNSKGNNASAGKQRPKYDGKEDVSFWKGYNAAASGLFGSSSGRYWNLSQTISGLPAGTYVITYQVASYNLGDNNGFTINNNPAPYTDLGESDPGNATVARNLASGQYSHSVTLQIGEEGKIDIKIAKEATKSASGAYYDNFNIKCIGVEGIKDMSVYDRVKIAIDDAQAKADEEGLKNYRNNQVVTLWAEQEIVGDGWAEVKKTYKNLAEAVLVNKEIGADYTYAIVNPSFELYPDYKDSRYTIDGAFPFGWSYGTNYSYDSGVWHKSDNNKKVENGCDGDYIYNTWPEGNTIYQDVTLTPGIYEVTAKVTSSQNNKIYLYAGDYKNSVTISQNADGDNLTLEPITLRFPVTDGKPIKIGVAGEKNGSFALEGGNWYKADDFHLTRIGGAETIKGMEMLQLAIDEVTSRLKNKNWYDTESQNELNKYQAMIDNYTLTGDGKKEFEEVYNIIRGKLFAQPTTNASGAAIDVDYTYAIPNNSFEWGNLYGWDVLSTAGDTDVKTIPSKSTDTYGMSQKDGKYCFNCYSNGRGTVISQTIPQLPSGHYKLKVYYANQENGYGYLEVVGDPNVASQRATFQIAGGDGVAVDEVLDFDVAEGTPQITFSAGGLNTDGSWDDYGGQWYKVDYFRLIRTGDPHICTFYERFINAFEEAKEVVYGIDGIGGLPEKYQEQWKEYENKYKAIIDKHLSDGHVQGSGEGTIDPFEGGNGVEQINAMFADLRSVVFSQEEMGADMSGAITNNSFELGDLTGWTTKKEDVDPSSDIKVTVGTEGTPTYGTIDTDGTYLFNAWIGDTAHPIWQTIPNMPSGRYTLTVKIASDPDGKFFIGANDKHSDIIKITKVKDQFTDFSFTFEVPVEAESKDVKIGVYPTTASSYEEINESHFADDATGSWYKVDHFRLTLDSRYMEVDWEMETDTHGTIMLPFPVKKETLDEMGLEAYTIKMKQKSSNETPADEDINTYRLLTWDGPHDGMIANVPYVLKNVAEQVQPVAIKAIKAAEGEEEDETVSPKKYTFKGYTQKTPEDVISPEGNLLTGTLIEVPAEMKQHHIQQIDDNVGFVLHDHADDNGVAHETIPAYHAYIDLPLNELFENGRLVSGFYFHEPVEYLKWEMETDKWGTLILPFDTTLPDDLEAYRVLGVTSDDPKNITLGTAEDGTYQVIVRTPVIDTIEVTDEDGNTSVKTKLTANTPYLVTYKTQAVAKAARKRIKAADADESTGYTFSGVPTNTEKEYKTNEGLMTGVIVSRNDKMGYDENGQFTQNSLNDGDRVLTGDAESGYKFEAVENGTSLPRYHAFIDADTQSATHLLFAEPEVTVPWTMDNQYVGTLMLPFDVDAATLSTLFEPYDMTACTIDEIGEWKETENHISYRVITTNAANSVTANTAYLVLIDSADRGDETDTQAEETTEATPVTIEFTGQRVDDETPVTTDKMLGVYENTSVAAGNYVACSQKYHEFKIVPEGGIQVAAYHAYVPADRITSEPSSQATYLVLSAKTVGVEEIMEGEVNVDIYTLDGVMVRRDVKAAEALQELDHGIYILRSAKGTVKVIK